VAGDPSGAVAPGTLVPGAVVPGPTVPGPADHRAGSPPADPAAP
jgi:hypothetical protein